MEWNAISKIVLSVLLIAVAICDLKTLRVSHLVTWPLLLVALAIRVWEGSWALSLLLLGLTSIEMLPQAWQIPSVALLVGGVQWGCWMLNDPVTIFVALWWGIPYALWTLNLLGGADVRIFMALVAFFPYPEMVAALWGGLALVSIIWLLVQYRRNALIPLVQAGQGMLGGQYPSRENLKKQGRPTTPGLVLGALVYMWSMMN